MLYVYLNLLYVHSKNSRNNINKNPFVLLVNEGEVNLLADSQLGTFFVALVTSWRCQVLLYVHAKCVRSCSMRIDMVGAALFLSCWHPEQHNWPT